jgi:hypothetical protein
MNPSRPRFGRRRGAEASGFADVVEREREEQLLGVVLAG